jgi:hypothetical protein
LAKGRCDVLRGLVPILQEVQAGVQVCKIEIRKLSALVNEDENPLWDRFSINAVPIVIAFDDKGKI